MECSWWIYFRICLATHREWAWSFCTGECSQHRSATMEKVHGCLEFLCIVQFLFYFVLLAWNCACLSALQYWLGYVCKCKASAYKSMCYCFSRGQNNHAPSLVSQSKTLRAGSVRLHLPHNIQQSMPCSYPPMRMYKTIFNFHTSFSSFFITVCHYTVQTQELPPTYTHSSLALWNCVMNYNLKLYLSTPKQVLSPGS